MKTHWNDWDMAQEDLGIEIVVPFELDVSPAQRIRAEFLVKNFGARHGMLVVNRYDIVRPYLRELENLGYGFCVLENLDQAYDREIFIDMLGDWGWTGDRGSKPKWLAD